MKRFSGLAVFFILSLTGLAQATLTAGNVTVVKNATATCPGGIGTCPSYQNGSITDTGTSSGPGNVGIGSASPIGKFDFRPGNVVYVGCSDSIATAYNNASSGDTLELGKCTYSISIAAVSSGTKLVHFKGRGKYETIIDAGNHNIEPFSFVGVPADFSDLSIIGTNINTAAVDVNLCGGTCEQTVSTGAAVTTDANYFHNVYINVSAPGLLEGINIYDGGYTLDNTTIIVSDSAIYPTSGQNYGIRQDNDASTNADTHTYINNSYIFNNGQDSVGGNSSTIVRGFRFYNWQNIYNTFNMFLYVTNSTIRVHDNAATLNGTEACHTQGNRITAYYYNSTCDGDAIDFSPSSFTPGGLREDLRCDDGATCYLYGTTLASNKWVNNAGTIVRSGQYNGSAIELDAGVAPGLGFPNAVDATPLIQATGTIGGYASTGTPGKGGIVNLLGGAGGINVSGTGTVTAGQGGTMTITGGPGGNQINASATTNNGGVGGTVSLVGGVGGAASNGSSVNSGGNGASVYLSGGNAGIGIGTGAVTGLTGNVFLGVLPSGTPIGNVEVGGSAIVNDQEFNVAGNSYFNGNIGIGSTVPISRLMMGTIPTSSNDFVAQGGWSATGIQTDSAIGTLGNVVISKHSASGLTAQSLGCLTWSGSNQTSGMAIPSKICSNAIGTWSSAPNNPTNITFFTTPSASSTLTEAMIIDQNQNVGIGTTTPAAELDVWGTLRRFIVQSTGNVGIGTDSTPDDTLEITGTSGVPPFAVSSTASASGDFIQVSPTGFVGIGTANPAQTLSIVGVIGYKQNSPTISSCGTSPSGSVVGNDAQGTITVGGTATGCTLAFIGTYAKSPHCNITNQSMSVVNALTYTESASGFVVSQAAGLSADLLDYHCTFDN